MTETTDLRIVAVCPSCGKRQDVTLEVSDIDAVKFHNVRWACTCGKEWKSPITMERSDGNAEET